MVVVVVAVIIIIIIIIIIIKIIIYIKFESHIDNGCKVTSNKLMTTQ